MSQYVTLPKITGDALSYRVKVSHKKGPRSLWGGPGLSQALTDTQLFLFVRVDDQGEEVTIRKKPTTNTPEALIGTLAAGECFLIPLDNAIVISATCTTDTYVDCAILGHGRH